MFYSLGILCSYCLQVTPTFKIMRQTTPRLYGIIPESEKYPWMKDVVLRALVGIICCFIAYFVPNLGQFLNLQGALTGTLICFVFPTLCYIKVFGFYNLSRQDKYLCICTLIYGLFGGLIASMYALEALLIN